MTGGYRLVEKYENAYHFIVARRPVMGNTLQSKSPTCSTMVCTKTTITMENKLSVNRRPAMGNIHIVINDYPKKQNM